MSKNVLCRKEGIILIVALWSLGVLTIFSVYLGIHARQKILLISRLEKRQKLQSLLESCMKKALVLLENDVRLSGEILTAEGKHIRHNNEAEFRNVSIGEDTCDIGYQNVGSLLDGNEKTYGLVDEESKMNINKMDTLALKNFLKDIFNWSHEEAQKLAGAIYDWRALGESQLEGFFSDEYYENLKYPYSPKKDDFEVFDELLLVRGMNKEIYEVLLSFVTIYGDGKININTASAFYFDSYRFES